MHLWHRPMVHQTKLNPNCRVMWISILSSDNLYLWAFQSHSSSRTSSLHWKASGRLFLYSSHPSMLRCRLFRCLMSSQKLRYKSSPHCHSLWHVPFGVTWFSQQRSFPCHMDFLVVRFRCLLLTSVRCEQYSNQRTFGMSVESRTIRYSDTRLENNHTHTQPQSPIDA